MTEGNGTATTTQTQTSTVIRGHPLMVRYGLILSVRARREGLKAEQEQLCLKTASLA
jgi:hypothetical protein